MRNYYKKAMQERIERGVKWLGSRTEEFWNNYADYAEMDRADILDGHWLDLSLDDLNLRNGYSCVLGLVGGNYQAVVLFANLNDRESSSMGFLLDYREYGRKSEFEYGMYYSMLTELWIEKITQLRQEREAERLITVYREYAAKVRGPDYGDVPDGMFESIASDLKVLGYMVVRKPHELPTIRKVAAS